MDKAKVLEIIEPSSDLDGKTAASSFDTRKIRTDSLDDADDFPEKEVNSKIKSAFQLCQPYYFISNVRISLGKMVTDCIKV